MNQLMLASKNILQCVRFMHKKPNENRMMHSAREDFLSFVHADTGIKVADLGVVPQSDLSYN